MNYLNILELPTELPLDFDINSWVDDVADDYVEEEIAVDEEANT